MRRYDIIIIGGGAAGVMAAGVAAANGCSVLICEKMEKPQRKVRITGKGRCNLTNMKPAAEFLAKVHAGRDFFEPAFTAFDNRKTVEFFESIGVPLTVERGQRVFPAGARAWDVAEAHVHWARSQGAEMECHAEVESIGIFKRTVRSVTVRRRSGEKEVVDCGAVVVATGGLSYPATGSTGDGLRFAYEAGHRIVEVRPSLTPLETDPQPAGEMNRLSLRNISAALTVNGVKVAEEFGELEFTATGISGPVTLRLSRQAVDALIDEKSVAISLDLKPALGEEQLRNRLRREKEQSGGNATAAKLMGKLLPSALIGSFLDAAGIGGDLRVSQFTEVTEKSIVSTLKSFTFEIVDYRPFTEAVITAGGVATDEIDPVTLSSRLVDGLFFAGEVIDIDADTGGYNLQIAYSTGHAAGIGAARYVKENM